MIPFIIRTSIMLCFAVAVVVAVGVITKIALDVLRHGSVSHANQAAAKRGTTAFRSFAGPLDEWEEFPDEKDDEEYDEKFSNSNMPPTSSARPVAKRRKSKKNLKLADFSAMVETHSQIMAEYADFAFKPENEYKFPALGDITVPSTERFFLAVNRAKSLRPESGTKYTQAHMDDYLAAIRELNIAWLEAESFAMNEGVSVIDEEFRDAAEMASVYAESAVAKGRLPEETKSFLKRAEKEMEPARTANKFHTDKAISVTEMRDLVAIGGKASRLALGTS